MHQVRAPGFGKRRVDLVQRRRKDKGWSGFMHQVRCAEMENGIRLGVSC